MFIKLNNNFTIIDLEKHDTKNIINKKINGELTVIWRDWDNIIQNIPKMIYVTSVFPNEIKGPHLHLKRTSYFTCIEGKAIFIIKDKNGDYHEFKVDSENPQLICVPNGSPSAHINNSNKITKILVLADVAWKPNDNEMIDVIFDDYDLKKWCNDES